MYLSGCLFFYRCTVCLCSYLVACVLPDPPQSNLLCLCSLKPPTTTTISTFLTFLKGALTSFRTVDICKASSRVGAIIKATGDNRLEYSDQFLKRKSNTGRPKARVLPIHFIVYHVMILSLNFNNP